MLFDLLQVQDLTQSLNTEQAERSRVDFERDKLKEQNSQVKAALQESYSKEQELKKKVCSTNSSSCSTTVAVHCKVLVPL